MHLWDVSSSAWLISFCPKLWKFWKTLFRTPTKQEIFQAHTHSLTLSLCPLPLSLSLSFSCTKYLFDQKTRENKNQLINKTSSLNNKSFYKVLNTQLRITLGVLFFYDAFVELNGRMLRLSPGERSLALMSRGLLPANVGRTRVLDELVIHSVCREHYCYCNGKLRSLKTRTMRSGPMSQLPGRKGKEL